MKVLVVKLFAWEIWSVDNMSSQVSDPPGDLLIKIKILCNFRLISCTLSLAQTILQVPQGRFEHLRSSRKPAI